VQGTGGGPELLDLYIDTGAIRLALHKWALCLTRDSKTTVLNAGTSHWARRRVTCLAESWRLFERSDQPSGPCHIVPDHCWACHDVRTGEVVQQVRGRGPKTFLCGPADFRFLVASIFNDLAGPPPQALLDQPNSATFCCGTVRCRWISRKNVCGMVPQIPRLTRLGYRNESKAASKSAGRTTLRLVLLRDTHLHCEIEVPDGDILIHAGDFSHGLREH
jgi:hypothetical protein